MNRLAYPAFLDSPGEMAALIRDFDWADTPVGPIETWPASLRAALGIVLTSHHPMFLWWGPELVQFYNEGYRPSLGTDRHPAALGARGRYFWRDIWSTIGPEIEGVMRHGRATWHEDQLVPIMRNGRFEEVYWTYGYSPVHLDDGTVGGTLVVVQEQTTRVVGERRLRTLRDLAAIASRCDTQAKVWSDVRAVLAGNPRDVAWFGIHQDPPRSDAPFTGAGGAWPAHASPVLSPLVARVSQTGEGLIITDARARLGDLPGLAWAEPVETVAILPVRANQLDGECAVLTVGASPRVPWDTAYHDFLTLAVGQIALSLASVRQREEDRRRTAALTELDAAKTAFFGNISHEFRTPLTLMLGPLEEALHAPDTALTGQDLGLVYRNAVRLLKLVTTLLEFSRVEAGRAAARFEPVDLATLTIDLCGTFRSLVERAGLSFVVDCETVREPVYVDRDMWERIVFNLMSNAFKFTLAGSISVSLRRDGSDVELKVRDTGIGIPRHQRERIWERFYRVESRAARTHDGSGIGLALVRAFVQTHGGTCHVESELGSGATFTVRLPLGMRHLDTTRIVEPSTTASVGALNPFVVEAAAWPSQAGADVAVPGSERPNPAARILVVDDNRDMRDYLRRLLERHWRVAVASDGESALAAARREPPDLVLADVMMPVMDGFALLAALRADTCTAKIPVMLLTARAGEEAHIAGWRSGADDYLAKPFAARELIARIGAQLRKGEARRLESAVHKRLDEMLTHAPVGIAILGGPTHVYEYTNPAYLAFVGDRAVVGKTVRDALPELGHQGILEILDGVYKSGKPYVGRAVPVRINRRSDGGPEQAFFDYVCQPLLSAEGQVHSLCVVAYEVTELARARRDAETAHNLTELALETGRLGSWRINLRTLERWNSPRCLANFGLGPEATLSYEDVIRVQHPEDRERVGQAMAQAIASGRDYACEYRVLWPDGTIHWLSARGRTMYDADGVAQYMAGNTLDVTQQHQLLEKLEQAKDDLEFRVQERTAELAQANAELARALDERAKLEEARSGWLRSLIAAQEDERRRVARELHDEMGQHLVALAIRLGTVGSLPQGDELQGLRGIVARMDHSVQRLAHGLRPPALDDLGLVAAIQMYVQDWSQHAAVRADVCFRNCDERLPPHLESTLYRIIQEALTNIARHSCAAHASVIVERRVTDLRLIVEDDGIGFDVGAAPANHRRYGLVGMRERAELLGGTLVLESSNEGTSIFITIPIVEG